MNNELKNMTEVKQSVIARMESEKQIPSCQPF